MSLGLSLRLAAVLAAATVVEAAEPAVSFDGRSLAGWKASGFTGAGTVEVVTPFQGGPGALVIGAGEHLSGVTWRDAASVPRTNYEVSLEAMRVEGRDFFCGLTFPVGSAACSLIIGGWGGMVVGISSIDHSDASENETTSAKTFASQRWYRIRLRVTDAKVEAWIDDENVVDLEREGKRLSLRGGDIELALPFGISTYQTKAAIRSFSLRRL